MDSALLDLAKADGIVSGTAVTGQISPANETETYKFDANAGDHFFLDVTGRSGETSPGNCWTHPVNKSSVPRR